VSAADNTKGTPRGTSSGLDAVSRSRLIALLAALIVTTAGDEIALVVLALKVSNHAHTMLGVSLLLVAGMLPGVLLSPVIGRIADSVRPATLLAAAMVAQAVVAFGMAAASSTPLVIGLAVVLGALGAQAAAATMVIVPKVVADEHLTSAISAMEVCRNVGFLIGPAVAGVLVTVAGPALGLVVNAVSFLVAAAFTSLLPATVWRRGEPAASPRNESAVRRRWNEGFRLLGGDPLLRRVLPVIVITVCATSMFNVALVFHVRQGLGLSAGAYGALSFAICAGLVAGPIVLRVPLRQMDSAVLTVACAGGIGAAMAASALVIPIAAIFVCLLVMGTVNSGQNVALRTVVIRRSPEAKRGAVGAAYGATLQGSVTLGFLLAAIPPPSASQLVIVVGGAVAVAASATGLVLLKVRPTATTPTATASAVATPDTPRSVNVTVPCGTEEGAQPHDHQS